MIRIRTLFSLLSWVGSLGGVVLVCMCVSWGMGCTDIMEGLARICECHSSVDMDLNAHKRGSRRAALIDGGAKEKSRGQG